MRNERYSLKNSILNALAFLWNSIKKACTSVIAFFKRCAAAVAGLFHSSAGTPREPVSDETRVFESVMPSRKNVLNKRSSRSDSKTSHEMPYISREHLSGEGKEHINMFTPRRHKSNFVAGVLLTSVKLLLIAIFMIGAAGFGTLIGIAKAYMDTTPSLDTSEIEIQAESSHIYDRYGNEITVYTGSENRDWASIDEIPDMLQKAFIAIEDIRFEYHSGVDIKRIVGAFVDNLMNQNVQGGSTITQQLIKNTLLSSERTYKRKIQEAYLAIQLEDTYTKPQILEAYLNTIPLGGTNYGVKAAAKDYFNKDLSQLTIRECAMLAGITQSPYLYNPRRCYYTANKPELVNNRTNNVLNQMYKAGYISKQQYEYALADNVTVMEFSSINQMYDMPYFVEYAIHDVIVHILKSRNKQDTKQNEAIVDQELRTLGYKIYTTVDPEVQHTVETSLSEWDAYPNLKNRDDAVIKYQNTDGSVTETKQPQAAAVVLDHKTGELRAVVGGRETPTAKKTLNRVYQSFMPVGSSIKPIAVYAPAIDKGYSDGTVVPNLPLPIEGWDSENGYPSGGDKLYGPVTLRTAIVNSLNSATAYTLLNLVGIEDSYNYLVAMGINPAHINKNGAGLALGTSGITPIEMAGAYGTIANGGEYLEPLSFTKVVDRNGNIIISADDIRETREVFKESTAWLITDMLIDAVQNGTGQKARIEGMTVGGKTGTNQDAKGIFFAGITPYYTSTLWIGHDKYKPLDNKVFSSEYAAPLWQDYMSKILKGRSDAKIIDKGYESVGLVKLSMCSVSGLIATDACELDAGGRKPVEAYFLEGTEPNATCDIHDIRNVDISTGKLATPYCPEDVISKKGIVLLPSDSIYWNFTAEKLAEYRLPYVFPAPEGFSLNSLTEDMPEYFTYYCGEHTHDWYIGQQALEEAKTAAQNQIDASKSLLSDPAITMTLEDRDSLNAKINELKNLIENQDSTSAAIEQKTAELKSLTDSLRALYSPPA